MRMVSKGFVSVLIGNHEAMRPVGWANLLQAKDVGIMEEGYKQSKITDIIEDTATAPFKRIVWYVVICVVSWLPSMMHWCGQCSKREYTE